MQIYWKRKSCSSPQNPVFILVHFLPILGYPAYFPLKGKEYIMASTTYHDFVDANKMYAAHKRFLDLTKTSRLGNVTVMVRNAGQLPQPFWLGAARGGGSCGAATVPART